MMKSPILIILSLAAMVLGRPAGRALSDAHTADGGKQTSNGTHALEEEIAIEWVWLQDSIGADH
jgi:hypothetical protein